MSTVFTDAIVVRVVDFGESDRVATLYTRSVGKVSALARGARRSRKRFGGSLELFGAGQATLFERSGELWRLDGLHSSRGFPRLGLDIGRVAHGAYVCELLRELVPPHHGDEGLFRLLEEMLGLLDGGLPSASLLRVFELALLAALGFAPSFDRCVGCDTSAGSAGERVDPRRGGMVCASCAAGERDAVWALDPAVRDALLVAQRCRLPAASELSFAPATADAAREIVQAILHEHLGKTLRSVEFIAKLNGARSTSPRAAG